MSSAVTSYAITEGGPLRGLERALRLTRGDERDWLRRAAAFLLIAYVPVLLIGVATRVVAGQWLPVVLQVETHVRALLAVPLLLVAEPLVDGHARSFGRYLTESRLIASVEGYEAAITRTARIRDSQAELLLLVGAIATAFVKGADFGDLSPMHWANLPAVVWFRALLLRWSWRWLLWGLFLARLARSSLALRPTHPDRLAGLAPVLQPSHAFAVVVAACACMIAGGWADRMIADPLPISSFSAATAVFLIAVIIVAHSPTWVFVPALIKARWGGLDSYGVFAHRYVTAFEARYCRAAEQAAELEFDAAEISTLADLGNSYVVVAEMQVVPFSRRLLGALAFASLLPLVPLLLVWIGLPALLQILVDRLL